MNILHLSNNRLPDQRIERASQTGKKVGHVISFAGPLNEGCIFNHSFDKVFNLEFSKYSNVKIPSHWRILKKRYKKILADFQPDLIHAHNIVAAKLASEFQVPFVYDDHEYWSKRCQVLSSLWKPNKLFVKWLWTGWEEDALRGSLATITVSDKIAEEHREKCEKVYVVPNFPSYSESERLISSVKRLDRLSTVYIGSDLSKSLTRKNPPYRNVEGYIDFFNQKYVGDLTVFGDINLISLNNVKSMGFLPHQQMMAELTKHHIGLLPWKKHWYHKYSNPNKPYEYAHAGLLVIAVSDFVNIKNNLREHCILYDDLNDLEQILSYYMDDLDLLYDLKDKIRKFALENLTWEKKCEPNLLRAYDHVI